jgi:hypothetical protein
MWRRESQLSSLFCSRASRASNTDLRCRFSCFCASICCVHCANGLIRQRQRNRMISKVRESVLFIGTQFSSLYTAVDTPARGRVGVCVVFVCLVFACKYVLGHSRVSQPLNLRLCLLRHLGFLTSPHASPTCSRRRLNSYRLLRRFTPDPPPIPWAYPLYLPASPRPPLYTSAMTT